jgi:hypothetical protein
MGRRLPIMANRDPENYAHSGAPHWHFLVSTSQMNRVIVVLVAAAVSACSPSETVVDGFGDGAQKLRAINRKLTRTPDRNGGVRLSYGSGNGVAWVEGSDFRSGTIEVDIRGQESLRQSDVGVAFHRKSDDSYEAVYLRPSNFRASDPARRQHAVQYLSLPDFDWPRLREDYPEQFENPVDPSLDPIGWVRLRVAVDATKLQIFVGPGTEPTLEVRKLGELDGGQVGLWVGNGSGGDFANLVIRPTN